MDSGINARYLASSEFIDFLPDQLVDEWLIIESSHKREIVYFIVNANILRVIITFMSPDPDCGQDASVLLIVLNTKAAKERTKDKKLITTKKNCKNVNVNILGFKKFEFLKFLNEK